MDMNPIIRRELVGTLRSRRATLVLGGLLLLLSVLVILRWPSDSLVNLAGEQSQQVLRIFGFGLMVGLIILAPAFPATNIVRERRSGTLALLLNSRLSPWSILTGKLAGTLGFVGLLIVVSLPPAAACFAMGGVDFKRQILPMYVVLVLLAMQYATLGLLISSIAASADTALRATYGMVIVMSVLTLGPYGYLHGLTTGVFVDAADWLRCVSPIPAMLQTFGQSDASARGLAESSDLVLRYSILALLSIVVFALWTMARLSGWMLDRPRSAGKITDDAGQGVRVFRRVMYLWFFDPNRRSGLIGPFTNPVTVKEFRCRRFGRKNWMMRLVLGCAIASLALAFATTRASTVSFESQASVPLLGAIIVILQMALIILLAPSLASGLISGERESGGWELLQLTPLSAWTIMIGKLASVAWTVTLILLASLPGYVVMILIDDTQKARVLDVLVSLVLTAVFCTLASAAVSSLFKRTAVATAVAYTLIVGLCGGTFLFWLGQDAPFSREVVQWVLRFNPVAGALQLIDAPGFGDYRLMPHNWLIMAAGCVLCISLLLYRTWRLTRPS